MQVRSLQNYKATQFKPVQKPSKPSDNKSYCRVTKILFGVACFFGFVTANSLGSGENSSNANKINKPDISGELFQQNFLPEVQNTSWSIHNANGVKTFSAKMPFNSSKILINNQTISKSLELGISGRACFTYEGEPCSVLMTTPYRARFYVDLKKDANSKIISCNGSSLEYDRCDFSWPSAFSARDIELEDGFISIKGRNESALKLVDCIPVYHSQRMNVGVVIGIILGIPLGCVLLYCCVDSLCDKLTARPPPPNPMDDPLLQL